MKTTVHAVMVAFGFWFLRKGGANFIECSFEHNLARTQTTVLNYNCFILFLVQTQWLFCHVPNL